MRTAGLALVVALLTPGQTPTGTGVIAGRVVEADSTRPVPEAIVTLSSGATGERRVMVDEQGRFAFANLPAGEFRLIAEQFGYLRGGYGRQRPNTGSLPIQLSDGQRMVDASISMWRFASIAGRVLDEAGEPVTGVTVQALRRSASAGRVDLQPSGQLSASTDDRGVYRLTRLAPGDYAVMVGARLSTFPVEILRDALTSGVNLGVGEVARLGDPRYLQVGDQVIATMSNSYGVAPPAPDSSGRFRIFQTTYYPAATSVEGAEVMRIEAGDERSAIDVRMLPVPAVSVSGRIVGPDGPVTLKPFRLIRAGGSSAYETYDNETATGITTADGTFKLLGVPSGRYAIRLGPTSISSAEAAIESQAKAPLTAASDPIVVGDSDVAGVSVTARPIAMLRGRVEAAGSAAALPSPESMELIIQAYDPGTFRVANPRVDKSGGFSTPLLPGRYLMTAFTSSGRCASVSVNGKEVGDALVPVGSDDLQVVFTCGAGMARITGRIRDANGNADLGGQAIVFPTDRRQWTVEDNRPMRFSEGRPNNNGVFTIANLPSGEYFVAAVPDAIGNAWQHPKVLEMLARSAARVTVGAGDTRSIDVTTTVVK